jgi:hypothetical protein
MSTQPSTLDDYIIKNDQIITISHFANQIANLTLINGNFEFNKYIYKVIKICQHPNKAKYKIIFYYLETYSGKNIDSEE